MPAWAQTNRASEEGVKVGFLFNFAKYTAWPASRTNAPTLLVCATGRNPFDGQIDLLQGRPLNDKTIEIRTGVSPANAGSCHVLYVSVNDVESATMVSRTLSAMPVLTVSDAPGFAEKGGMIEMRMEENRMHFHINLAAAERAELKLSSQMLKLAERIWK